MLGEGLALLTCECRRVGFGERAGQDAFIIYFAGCQGVNREPLYV
jgi:hypothetical protein